MSGWNGAGVFNRIYSWVNDAANGIDIIASRMDADTNNITLNGFGNCLTRDGQGSATAALPMNGFTHTGVGNATQVANYAAAGQIQLQSLTYAIGAGTGNAVTVTIIPAIAALTDGLRVQVKAPAGNTITNPTFSPNGQTATVITKGAISPLAVGDYVTGQILDLQYIASVPCWSLLNPNTAFPFGYTDITTFGGSGNGSTDNYQALVNAFAFLAAQGGGILYVPNGNFAIVSATASAISVPNNVTVQGAGQGLSIITLTGTTEVNNLFTVTNPQNNWFQDITIYGNSTTTSDGAGGAILFIGALSSTTPMYNFGCRRLTVANFKQPSWLYVWNRSNAPMHFPLFEDISAISYSGNMLDPTNIGDPSNVIAFLGQWDNLGGFIYNGTVNRGNFDCTWIKGSVAFWSGIKGMRQLNAKVLNAGANASDNTSGYGTTLYNLDSSRGGGAIGSIPPTQIIVEGNEYISPRSCGVYCADADTIFIRNNFVSGQSDATTANPDVKGALALGTVKNAVVVGNILVDNYIGIKIRGSGTTGNVISDNIISSSVTNATGIQVSAQAGVTLATTRTLLSNNDVNMTGAGSIAGQVISNTSGGNPGYVSWSGGRLEGVSLCFSSLDSTSGQGALCPGVDLFDIYMAGSLNAGIACQHISVATPFAMRSCTIDGAGWSGACVGLAIGSSTVVNIQGNIFKNWSGSGILVSCDGARGSAADNQWFNTAARISSTDFMIATPTWSATRGTFIQNASPSGPTHQIGWTNDSGGNSGTTWDEL